MRLAFLILLLLPLASVAQEQVFALVERDPARKSTAALFSDVDGDGRLDLLFGDGNDQNGLYLNTGAGRPTLSFFSTSGAPFTDGVFADFDNDGDPDLAVGSLSRGSLIMNAENGYALVPSVLSAYNDTRSIDVADVNGDGRLDIFLGRRFGDPNILLLAGPNGFVRQPGLHETTTSTNATCWADFDHDGDPDVYVANGSGEADVLYRNDSGTLTPAQTILPVTSDASSTVCTWGDVDADGDLDVFVASSSNRPSRLFLNAGGMLSEAPLDMFPRPSLDAFGASWGDVDNDGDLDLVVVNRYQPARLYLFEDGQATESVIRGADTGASFSVAAALADYNGDGKLDLAIANGNADVFEESFIFVNRTRQSGGWLAVRPVGTSSVRDGIGARMTAYVEIDGQTRRITREVQAHTARRSQAGRWTHFGLGNATVVDSLVVEWPSGARQVLHGIGINTSIDIEEPALPTRRDVVEREPFSLLARPNPAVGMVRIMARGATTGPLAVEAFDTNGRRVWHEIRFARAGDRGLSFEWHPDATVASGVYIVRAVSGGATVTTRVTLVR